MKVEKARVGTELCFVAVSGEACMIENGELDFGGEADCTQSHLLAKARHFGKSTWSHRYPRTANVSFATYLEDDVCNVARA